MSKGVAAALLVVGGCAACVLGGFGALLTVLLISAAGYVVAAAVLAGHTAGAVALSRLFRRKYDLRRAAFWLMAALPSAVLSAAGLAAVLYLDSIDYFKGFFPGLGEFVFALSATAYSLGFAAVSAVVLWIDFRRGK